MKFGDAMKMAQNSDYIKPRYHAYIKGPRDIEAERLNADFLLAKPERDRTKSWAASGAGKCLRQRQFAYNGMQGKSPDDHALNIFLNGTWTHLRHQVAGLSAGYLKEAEVPLFKPELNLVGTMDAIDDTGTPVEYKSINQNGFMQVRQFGVKAEHLMQVHSYMLAGDYSGARVVYENKNTNDLLEFYVERDEATIAFVHDDLENLQLAQTNGYLLPMLEECTRKEGAYRWCPFASQCPKGAETLGLQAISGIQATFSSGSDLPQSPYPPDSHPSRTSSLSSTSTGTSSSDEKSHLSIVPTSD